MLNDKKKIIVSTGNILSANKKAGQKTTEEVSEFLFNKNFIFFFSFLTQNLIILTKAM